MANELDEMMSDEFLDSLDESQSPSTEKPSWVVDESEHTTYKVYHAILDLEAEVQEAIKSFGKIATAKTKKFYQIKKSNVARIVGLSAQSIFNTSSFSKEIERYFDEVNKALFELHEIEQKKQVQRKRTGIRVKKKETIVLSHQELEKKYNNVVSRNTKETLDLAIRNMPIDLKVKLGFFSIS